MFLFLIFFLYPVLFSNSEELLNDLNYMGNDNKPFIFEEKGLTKGISVDILRLIWEDLGIPDQQIKIYPWARALNNLENDEKSVLIGIVRTSERENICKWVGPFAKLRFGVFALKSRSIVIKNFDDLNSYIIGTINKDIVEEIIIQKGFKGRKESSSKNIHNLRKLKAGRIDLAGSFEISFYEDAVNAGYSADDFEMVYVLKETEAYFGFNKNIPDEIIKEFQNSLNRNRDKIDDIIDFYLKR